MRLSSTYVFEATLAGQFVVPARTYLKVGYVSSTKTLSWWFSADGLGWVPIVSAVSTNAITLVGLFNQTNVGANSRYFDYFRRIA
jgi:hypothetical protein